MRSAACLLALIAAGVVYGDDADRTARLVGRLASPDFRERETATRELDRLGEAAVEPLRRVLRTADAETRGRAAALIEQIERRRAASCILAPTTLDLNYDRTPLGQALADVAARTDMAISMRGLAGSIADRKVTLFADKVSAWQAIQLLCNQAGIHEWDGFSRLPAHPRSSETNVDENVPNAKVSTENDGIQVLGQMQVRRGQVTALTVPSPHTRIVLLDGPSPVSQTFDAGSVRIRAAPPGAPFSAEVGKDLLVVLQVAAEARLYLDGATDLRVERAIDERGHERTGRPIWAEPPDEREDWPRGVRLPTHIIERKHGPVAIRFERGEDPPKRLRELVGVMTVQPFVLDKELAWDRPAAAVGKVVRSRDVVASLLSFAYHSGKEVRLIVEAQLPYGTRLEQSVAGLIGFPGRGFGRGWAGFVPDEAEPAAITGDEYQGIAVIDGVGRRFPAVTGATEIVGLFPRHYTIRITATYRAPAHTPTEQKQWQPAKVTFSVRRPTTVDVPFVLRNVPLP